ncbi:DUF4189 domain-containing protein [Nocardia inohanensis]|uniref:DUF4189 domain-containing protein n=1 Tax=Nocardia inohanensis TaxID=209246 RepID=UPI000A3EB701|nr:DUF4189 domain-containing protein [Nocardia inohanensis]
MSVTRILTPVLGSAAVAMTLTAGTAGAAGQGFGTIAISQIKNAAVVSTGAGKVPADAAAIRDCGNYDCEIVFRFADGCGAIAQGADGKWGWAAAGSREEAEQNAVAGLGESAPAFPDLGSSTPRAARVVSSACTS